MPSRDEIIKILKSPPSNLTDEISKKIADQILNIPGTFMIIGTPEINKQVRFNLKLHNTVLNSIYKTKSAEKMVINLNASIKPK